MESERTESAPLEARRPRGVWMIGGPLVLGFLASLVLAYQAYDAGRQHRQTARATAREHAGFAAYLIGSSVDRAMQEALLYGFYPIDLAWGGDRDALPPPEALRANPEAARCDPELPADRRRFFRMDLRTEELTVAGPTSPAFEASVRSTVRSSESDGRGIRHWTAEINGSPSLVAYRVWSDEDREVAYGFESCWRTSQGNAFELAIAGTQALPPSLVGDTPNDSLFTVVARTGDGAMAFGDAWTRPPSTGYEGVQFYGTVPVGQSTDYAGLEVRVTLLSSAAERLVLGGMPASRLPLALGLVGLTGLLLAVAVLQLRREQALVRLRSRFVRNVSHELRTPLQQVLLFTDLLRSGRLDGEQEKREALDIMHAETHRLIALVQNILRFSTQNSSTAAMTDVDLGAVARETVHAFRPLAAASDADVSVSVNGAFRVRANREALKRVLINLLDNAVKYGPSGQTVRVQVAERDGWGEVSVTDDGPGIPEPDRAHVWEAFGRLDREEARGTAGSGIGLSIVREDVTAMGGTVRIADGDPRGARFEVRLALVPTIEGALA